MFEVGYTDTKAFRSTFKKLPGLHPWSIKTNIINRHHLKFVFLLQMG